MTLRRALHRPLPGATPIHPALLMLADLEIIDADTIQKGIPLQFIH